MDSKSKIALIVTVTAIVAMAAFVDVSEETSGAIYEEGIFTFEVSWNNVVSVTGFTESASAQDKTDITIPGSFTHDDKNYTVTEIDSDAFINQTEIQTVTISSSITDLGSSTFENCTSLTKVIIEGNVTAFGSSLFEGCTSLTTISTSSDAEGNIIDIPSSVTAIGSNAFKGCTALTSVKMPSVTSILNSAFSGCTSLADVSISQSLTVPYLAFEGCTSLKSFSTGADSKFTYGAFNNCPALESFSVDSDDYFVSNGLIIDPTGILVTQSCADDADVTIPSKIKDGSGTEISITSIATNAFKYSTIKSVTIESGIQSIGNSAFEYCANLESVIIEDGLVSIGSYAFQSSNSSQSKLTTVSLPDTVTSIGGSAFRYCDALTTIDIPASLEKINNYAFDGCTSLTTVIGGESVKSVGQNSFVNCSSLTSISFPECTSIGSSAFSGCDELESVVISEDASIYTNSFSGCGSLESLMYGDRESIVGGMYINDGILIIYNGSEERVTIPADVTRIASAVFENKSAITTIVFEEGSKLTTVDSDAFNGCINLKTVENLPAGVTLKSSAFEGCTSLSQIDLSRVSSIGSRSFEGCTSLADIELSTGVNVGSSAFEGCTEITSVHVPAKATFDLYAFRGCTGLTTITMDAGAVIGPSMFYGCTGLKSLEIEDDVTVGASSFYGCTGLTTITIGDNVYLNDGAFGGCSNVTAIDIGSLRGSYNSPFNGTGSATDGTKVTIGGLEEVSDWMFSNFTGLKSIVIPEGVTSIGNYVFSDCTKLESVVIPGSVETIGAGIFQDCTSLNLVMIGDGVQSTGTFGAYSNRDVTIVGVGAYNDDVLNAFKQSSNGTIYAVVSEDDSGIEPLYTISESGDTTTITVNDGLENLEITTSITFTRNGDPYPNTSSTTETFPTKPGAYTAVVTLTYNETNLSTETTPVIVKGDGGKVVTFYDGDEASFAAVLSVGDTIPEREGPTHLGLKFEGWYTDKDTKFTDFGSTVAETTGDIDLYAKYSVVTPEISITSNGTSLTLKIDQYSGLKYDIQWYDGENALSYENGVNLNVRDMDQKDYGVKLKVSYDNLIGNEIDTASTEELSLKYLYTVTIEGMPTGTDVYVSGNMYSENFTESEFRIPNGTYTFTVNPGGFSEWEKTTDVNDDLSLEVELTLKSPELKIVTTGDLTSDGKVVLTPVIDHYLKDKLTLTYTCTGPNGDVELNSDGTFTATSEGKYTISVKAKYEGYESEASAKVDITKSAPGPDPEPEPTPGGDDEPVSPPSSGDDEELPPVIRPGTSSSSDDDTVTIVACAAAAAVAAILAVFLIMAYRKD